MRGVFFQKPLELQLEIEGESWSQGQPVRGVLTLKNRGSEPMPLGGIKVFLAHGKLREIRAKDPEAFEILATSASLDQTLAPGAEARMAWEFPTDRNSPITDNLSSLFVICGQEGATEKMGQLQLNMNPYPAIEDVLKALQIQNRFVVKSRKHSKGRVEVKLSPPDSKAFGSVEQLVVYFRFEGERLAVQYHFTVKKVEATAASVATKKEIQELEQELAPMDYTLPSGRPNHEKIEASVSEALDLVRSKVLF